MRNRKLTLLAGLATLLAGVAVAVSSSLAMATAPPSHKVTICHALPEQASHPYNELSVDIASSGYLKAGHSEHEGDIIPPYTYERADHSLFTYDGKNWDSAHEAIYNNGCNAVTPSESPSPTPGESPSPTPTPSEPAGVASPTPTPTGGVSGVTATPTPTGGVLGLAETGSGTPAPLWLGFGLLLILVGGIAVARALRTTAATS